jgi:deazaflavin-dependent oxidoreductase (nitroreductase family)
MSRLLYRAPIPVFRLGLGGLFGGRLLLLEHRGRTSGRLRRAVIEVLRRDPERRSWIVSAGWGERTQWWRNLRREPRAAIRIGLGRISVEARLLEPAEAEAEVVRYGRTYPRAARAVARLVGYELDGSEADLRAFAGVLRLVELRRTPIAAASSTAIRPPTRPPA